MEGYDGFRLAFQTKLLEEGRSEEDVSRIMNLFCLISQDYEIQTKCTDLIVYEAVPKVVDEYLACKKMEGRSDGTIANYRGTLYTMFRYIRKPYDELTHKDIWGFLLQYQSNRPKPVSNRTMNQYLGVIKYFYQWLQDIGYMTTNPTKGIAPIKFEKKKKAAMNRHDLIILLDACENIREKAIISLAYATGCRVSELCSMKKSDIRWADKSIVVFGKGKKYRTVFFNDQADIFLRQYLDSRKDESPFVIVSSRGAHSVTTHSIRVTIRNIYTRVSDSMSTKVTPHIIRHTTATLAIQSGMPVTTVQQLLGHESIETTMEYVDMGKVNVTQEYKKYVV